MTEEQSEQLLKYVARTRELLRAVPAMRDKFKEDAINFGDLDVTNAEWYEDMYGDKGIRIHIEEAGSDSHQLRRFLTKEFKKLGCTSPLPEFSFEW